VWSLLRTLRRPVSAPRAKGYNDVIRAALKLPRPAKAAANGGKAWAVSDAGIPEGSEFRANYKGKIYSGAVRNGHLELNDGSRFSTPSAAAGYITKTNVTGWRFWRCKLPGQSEYVLFERLRGKPQ
jgi:hypothetical protein